MRNLGRSQSIIHLRTVSRNVLSEGWRAVVDLKFELPGIRRPIHIEPAFRTSPVLEDLFSTLLSGYPGIVLRVVYFDVLEESGNGGIAFSAVRATIFQKHVSDFFLILGVITSSASCPTCTYWCFDVVRSMSTCCSNTFTNRVVNPQSQK